MGRGGTTEVTLVMGRATLRLTWPPRPPLPEVPTSRRQVLTGKLIMLDSTGHTDIEFDTSVPASMEVAQETYRRAFAEGKQAFNTTDKQGGTALNTPELPTDVEEITFI